MDRRRLPKHLPPELEEKLFRLFEAHFGVTLRRMRHPETGVEYVDFSQLCDVLGVDVDEARAQLLADPDLGEGLLIFDPDPLPPLVPADVQRHEIGLCEVGCRFCRMEDHA